MNHSLSSVLQQHLTANKMVFIAGPTGVGKSAAAVEAALAFGAEIVSCDAMQVYREVNIASDKPAADMRARVPHHLLDVVSVAEEFNVARFRALALAAIDDILRRGRKVIVCGGSGMYMMSLLDGLFESPAIVPGVREALTLIVDAGGLPGLYERLRTVDPAAAQKISPNDRQRIIRALEVFDSTGKPLSGLQPGRDGLWGKYPVVVIGLTRARHELYARAEARIEMMFGAGLVDEVRGLRGGPVSSTASRIIGVREVGGFIDGEYSCARAVELMKLNTRHYIKRQLTWFRKDIRIQWVELT
jgi:tRNA dimethylallyltransferase